MNIVNMTQRKTPPAQPPKTSCSTDAAFDLWLNRGLHRLYDDVANEPVPDELLKIIQDSQKK